MKKVLMLVAVAGFLASCDNAGDAAKREKDSLDSIKNIKTDMIDSSANKSKDSVTQTIDAQKDLVDSMNKGVDTTKPKM